MADRADIAVVYLARVAHGFATYRAALESLQNREAFIAWGQAAEPASAR